MDDRSEAAPETSHRLAIRVQSRASLPVATARAALERSCNAARRSSDMTVRTVHLWRRRLVFVVGLVAGVMTWAGHPAALVDPSEIPHDADVPAVAEHVRRDVAFRYQMVFGMTNAGTVATS